MEELLLVAKLFIEVTDVFKNEFKDSFESSNRVLHGENSIKVEWTFDFLEKARGSGRDLITHLKLNLFIFLIDDSYIHMLLS